MRECPLCGEESAWGDAKGWHYCHDPEYLEPDEGWCDFCGFNFQQHTPSPHDDMLKALDDYSCGLESHMDSINEQIKELQDFKKKIPKLRERIDFDALRIKLGWKKTKDGWTKD